MKAASQRWLVGLTCVLLFLPLALSPALAFSPVRVATLPNASGLSLPCGDANRNGRSETYCTVPNNWDTLVAFEYQGKASNGSDSFFRIVVAPTAGEGSIFGDGDNDGLMDVVTRQVQEPRIALFESPDSFSFPTDSVWCDPHPCVAGDFRPLWADVDCDGRTELLANIAGDVWIYKYCANNMFDSVSAIGDGLTCGQFATADFDLDSLPEVVMGDADPNVYIYEWTGVRDSFALSAICTTGTFSNYAVTAPGDVDGDGWPELVVAGRVDMSDWTGKVKVYEAVAKHEYRCVWEALTGVGGLTAKYLASGDVDGDDVNEFVYAHGAASVYKCTGPDQYELIGELDTCSKYVQLYDLNGDGRAEIIIDCGNHVAIYEDTTGLTQVAEAKPHPRPLQISIRPAVVRLGASVSFSDLPEQSGVGIYSANGQLIRKQTVSKSATWRWNLTDQTGRPVPPGTYFVTIRSQGRITQTKLCVIR